MKKEYNPPLLEVKEISVEETVITTSGDDNGFDVGKFWGDKW